MFHFLSTFNVFQFPVYPLGAKHTLPHFTVNQFLWWLTILDETCLSQSPVGTPYTGRCCECNERYVLTLLGPGEADCFSQAAAFKSLIQQPLLTGSTAVACSLCMHQCNLHTQCLQVYCLSMCSLLHPDKSMELTMCTMQFTHYNWR